MALENVMRVDGGHIVTGGGAGGNSDMTLATLEGTAYTVASGANHAETIPITYPAGYTRVIGVVGFYLGNSALTPWQIEISGDDVIVNVFNHYGNSANAKTRLTLLFAK